MAKLSSKQRKAMPSSEFAGPGRSFPVNDRKHAKAALMDVNKAKGLSSGQKQKIRARARAKLRSSDKPKSNRPETDLRKYARGLHKRMVG